jgi:hypothetical protein
MLTHKVVRVTKWSSPDLFDVVEDRGRSLLVKSRTTGATYTVSSHEVTIDFDETRKRRAEAIEQAKTIGLPKAKPGKKR